MHHRNIKATPGSITDGIGTFIITMTGSDLTNFRCQDMWLDIDGISFQVLSIMEAHPVSRETKRET